MKNPGISTQLIHGGELRPRFGGSVCLPIFQSATFEHSGDSAYDDVVYARLNNTPNHTALHAKLALLEKTETALVTASGMAAVSAVLLTLLRQGDHLLVQTGLYGGTHSFVTQDLVDFGVAHTFTPADQPERWADALRPESKVFYVESIGNPLLVVPELEEVVKFCRAHNLISVIDSTFTSPVNFCPRDLGFEVIVHSATKYLNGHSDIVAGAVAGSRTMIDKIRHRLNHVGGSLDPHACFLLHRGLKTLQLRVERQNHNALALASWLAQQPGCQVNYPGLAAHASHPRAKRWFRGCGGVLSFEMAGDLERTLRLLRALELPVSAPSLGGVETLITRPCTTSHVGLSAQERAASGISDKLVRVAVGIEDEEDLLADFAQALEAADRVSR